MNEEAARTWLRERFPREVFERLESFASLVLEEAERQNLIAASTRDFFWNRHIVDSAQLVSHAADESGAWLDIGTGAGFPGMVLAIVRPTSTILVEPRRRRADFLRYAADMLGLSDVTVEARAIEAVEPHHARFVSARAVAKPAALLTAARRQIGTDTTVVLPRGASAQADLAQVRSLWHGMFHVEPSVTDPDAGILIGRELRPR